MGWFGVTGAAAGAVRILGGGLEKEALRRASAQVGSWSPSRQRDWAELGAVDLGEVLVPARAPEPPGARWLLLGPGEVRAPIPGDLLLYLGPRIPDLPSPGTAWIVGSRLYTKAERDRARLTQRLLPLHELSFEVALRTAADELRGRGALHLHLDLELLGPEGWALPAHELRGGLGWLFPLEVRSLRLTGCATSARAALGAELLRDLALGLWRGRGPRSQAADVETWG